MTPLEVGAITYAVLATFACIALYRERREMEGRLYQAFKDGYQVPPPEEQVPEPIQPPDVYDGIPSVIMDWLSRWEEENVKQIWARKARTLLAKYNNNVVKVLNELDEPRYG